MEPYLSEGVLIPEAKWHAYIDALKERVQPATKEELRDALVAAVLDRAKIQGKIGVFFSGGVDSTLIAWILKKHDIPFMCYTVGFQDDGTKEPEDIIESHRAAQELDFKQGIAIFSLDECEFIFQKTAKYLATPTSSSATPHIRKGTRPISPGQPPLPNGADGRGGSDGVANSVALNPIIIGVGGVVVGAADLAKHDGCNILFGGLGSEEIFAGYQRHEHANTSPQAVQEECWAGLKAMWARDLERDCALAKSLKITVLTPFLDERVILAAMGISGSEKIKEKDGVAFKKFVLRQVAQDLGLPASFAWRPKRAAQYGSRFDSALDKLAKKKNMRKSEYVENLV